MVALAVARSVIARERQRPRQSAFQRPQADRYVASFLAVTGDSSLRAPAEGMFRGLQLTTGRGAAICLYACRETASFLAVARSVIARERQRPRQSAFQRPQADRYVASFLAVTGDSSLRAPAEGMFRGLQLTTGRGAAICLSFLLSFGKYVSPVIRLNY